MPERFHGPPRPPCAASAGLVAPMGPAGTPEVDALYRALTPALGNLHLEEAHLHLAWEMAFWERDLSASSRRAAFLLVVSSLAATQGGSSRLLLSSKADGVLRQIVDTIVVACEGATPYKLSSAAICRDLRELVEDRAAPALIGTVGQPRSLVADGEAVYPRRLLQAELTCAALVEQRLGTEFPHADERALRKDVKKACSFNRDWELSPEQRQAVHTAGRRGISVISGGPGTGKTSIVVAIARLLAWQEVAVSRILMAAPTGKAAHRMNEAIQKSLDAITNPSLHDARLRNQLAAPMTLHRLLGYTPNGRFRHHRHNPLDADAVIVDEASMIDLELMVKLLSAVPDGARLVLLGDADQLPSVAAGAVLRDLVESPRTLPRGERWAMQLGHSFRMDADDPRGKAILLAAAAVRQGRSPLAEAGDGERPEVAVRDEADQLSFAGVELLELSADGKGLAAFLRVWFDERVASLEGFAELCRRTYCWRGDELLPEDERDLTLLREHVAASRVLALTRGNRTGCVAINADLHDRHERRLGSTGGQRLLPGEPVMMLRNDYSRGIFNGDQGILVWIQEDGRPRRLSCVFHDETGYRLLAPEALGESLELCYAMTIHKSQGSEFRHTAVVLPGEPIPLLTREILYTGITRSSTSVTLVGSREMLAHGAGRKLRRDTGLGERLKGS